MIALTGAAGKTGRAVARRLAADDIDVRPIVRRSSTRGQFAADLHNVDALAKAFENVEIVYHIPPNLLSDEARVTATVIEAALRSGVRRIVYHSVMRPGLEVMPHHWAKLRSEEMLWECPLEVTVLQPCVYADNFARPPESGLLQVPYSLESRFSFVSLDDVARAARVVLLDSGHVGATYELAGPARMSVRQIAAVLGIHAREISIAEWAKQNPNIEGYAYEALRRMFEWYNSHGLEGSPTVLRALLGHRLQTFSDAVREAARSD